MKSYPVPPIPSSEITPRPLFEARRKFMQTVGGGLQAAMLRSSLWAGEKLAFIKKSAFSVAEELTAYKSVTGFNNFYEFGACLLGYAPRTFSLL